MNFERLVSVVSRLLFAGSLLLIGAALLERVVNVFGYTILPETSYSTGRLLEFGTMFLIVVIVLLLRQVRDELRHMKTGRV